jgi:hypothetical protein
VIIQNFIFVVVVDDDFVTIIEDFVSNHKRGRTCNDLGLNEELKKMKK